MKAVGLYGVHRRRIHGTTRRDLRATPSDDLVKRQFVSEALDRLWVADITEHPTAEGKLYLASVIDVFSRKVVGWAMGEAATAELVVDAVNMAVRNRKPDSGLIHHSDHGCQYTSITFLQTELLDRNTWLTRRSLSSAIFDYIEVFYNRRRRHSALGYMSPMEYEAARSERAASKTHSAA